MNSIIILGSTGSIGTQALDVIDKLNIKVSVLTARQNITLLEKQIRKYKPEIAVVTQEKYALQLRENIKDTNCKVICGKDSLCQAASYENGDMILNALVGIAGLLPTMAAINAGKTIALANKETLATAGKLVIKTAKDKNIPILPVDSEHSAIFQCLQGVPENSLKKILLTASGGPFLGKTINEMKNITPDEALKHPNWDMGAKITIDSATMMNKGLELIEAVHLFNVKPEQVQIIVHPESVIHSMIELNDNSIIAQMGVPDMRIPIQYALTYPKRLPSPAAELDLFKYCALNFLKPDFDNFKCLSACLTAIKRGGLAPCAANGANEAAVKLFLDKKISFTDIGELVTKAMLSQPDIIDYTISDVLQADKNAREFVFSQI